MNEYIAAIDQGPTSTRFMIFDHTGRVVAIAQQEHKQIFPNPGWVEHNPMEILRTTQSLIVNTLTSSNINKSQIAAIGITNQRETTIVWDKITGKPVCNAIVWQDTRTKGLCEKLVKEGGMDRFRLRTGLPIATYFSGPKLIWILETIEGVRTRAEKGEVLFGNIDTWLIWNLTGGINGGVHITDVTNASRTLLMDIYELEWDDEILAMLGIPKNILPEIKSSSEIYGYAIDELGGVPISGDLGDQQAALYGQTCFSKGEAKNTYGTGCFLLLNTGSTPIQSKNGLLTTVGYQIKNQPAVYALEGSVAVAGALVQWLRDNLGLIRSADEIEDMAKTVDDNGGIYFVPAFSGLFAPYWKSNARGVIAGLTRFINK